MIRHVIECDTCKKQVDIVQGHLRPDSPRVPETWLMLVEGDLYGSEPLHFCSLSHLYRWSSDRLKESGV